MATTNIECPKCWGGGNVGEDDDGNEVPCPTCDGVGEITVNGE